LPTRYEPTAQEFAKFVHELVDVRFFAPISRSDFWQDKARLGLKPPRRKREGPTRGYEYHFRGLRVRVWTTWLIRENRVSDTGSGWVLILDGDRIVYSSHPLHRTKNFLNRLLMRAKIARARVRNRPICPIHKCWMVMCHRRGVMKSLYWGCPRIHPSGKMVWASIDDGLPKEAMRFLRPSRKKSEKYRRVVRRQGKDPFTALKRRRAWKISRPENIQKQSSF